MVAFNKAFHPTSTALPRLTLTGSFDETQSPETAVAEEAADAPEIAGRIGRMTDDVITLDRRVHPRQHVSLRVGGRRLDHSIHAMREPLLNLSLNDVSVGGLRADSQTRLNVGERVAVFFPPQAGSRGWDAYGRVVRVEPAAITGAACTVAVAFDAYPAA